MRIASSPSLVVLGFLSASLLHGAEPARLTGFKPSRVQAQLDLEKKFDAQLKADDQRAWMLEMASAPNHVGTPHDKANADFMLKLFTEWGWDARIETFEVLYPTPKKVSLELVAPHTFVAKLKEPPVEGDRTSVQVNDELPPYNGYGADGDVTGELVYANQGMPDDYKELAAHGIDVKGRIVITRYGGGWRGLKPKLAHEHGAIGCLIYSDPRDDGFGAGDAYPKGGFRPADGVQRGSVMDMMLQPGDPLTLDGPATKGAKRSTLAEAPTLMKIPVLPISHADALPLLAALDGAVVPEKWRGALPITYHFGPGPAKVRLQISSDWSLHTIHNVIAEMKGSAHPDEWVLRGNHHDAWVFGAQDPLSGNVAMMAEMKAIGALAREGWRPRRTLVYCSWDAEEPGLIGSTEWTEAHADELRAKAVLYVNSDGNGRGFLGVSGVQSLQSMLTQVADSVRDPERGVSVLQRACARLMVKGGGDDRRAGKFAAAGVLPVGALGSGSDFTAFIDHLGIASLNLSFGGESDTDGVYHSAYDSFDHFTRFGDPGFAYGVALAQTAGRIVLRTAEADVLPHVTGAFSDAVTTYADSLEQMITAMRVSTKQQHRLLDEKLYDLASDPTEKFQAPARDAEVPALDFKPLQMVLVRLKKASRTFDDIVAAAMKNDLAIAPAHLAAVNATLRSLEQTLLAREGLPGRPWFQHMIFAPGMMTGYAVKTLPGIREAIEDRRWVEATKYVQTVAHVLDGYCDALDKAAGQLKAD